MRTRTWTVAAAFALTVALTGCGGDDDDAADAGGDDTATTVAPDDAGTDDTGGGEASGDGITASGFAFSTDALSAAPGGTFTFTNDDGATHTFTIDDTDVDVEVEGGSSGEVTAPTEPGDYDFHCRFHSGMQGVLTVA